MKPVLWLASWYPSRVHPTNGDFVERHAKAVSRLQPVVVLLVEKDETLPKGKTETVITEEPNLIVYKVYYAASRWKGLPERIFSLLKYRSLQRKWYAIIQHRFGTPLLVHVHVAMKAGLLAVYLKNKKGIPFVLTEHWTGYYRESNPNIYTVGAVLRRLTKLVVRNASVVLPVSRQLGQKIAELSGPLISEAIPNAVDRSLFYYSPSSPEVFRFIHPSYLNFQKNPEGMIEAAAALTKAGYSFELVLIGNAPPELVDLARQKGVLNKTVFILPAVSHAQIALEMQQSSALLLFSRFENLPCVVLEALCCGLPVISSRVGGIEEVVNGDNGILVESQQIPQLTLAMKNMIEQYPTYNRAAIAARATALFSFETVGAQYAACYKKLLPATVQGS